MEPENKFTQPFIDLEESRISKLTEFDQLWQKILEKELNYDFAELILNHVSPSTSMFITGIEIDSDVTTGPDLVTALVFVDIDSKIRIAKEVLERNIENTQYTRIFY